jgi:hypothetical protein
MNPMRANSERLAAPQVPRKRRPPGRQTLADNYHPSSHNVFRSLPSNHRPGTPFSLGAPGPSHSGTRETTRKWPAEAETSRNSFARNILQGTSLFSIFCSATLPVSSRKQGFCVQSMGGGTRCSSFAGLSRPTGGRVPQVRGLHRQVFVCGVEIHRI